MTFVYSERNLEAEVELEYTGEGGRAEAENAIAYGFDNKGCGFNWANFHIIIVTYFRNSGLELFRFRFFVA